MQKIVVTMHGVEYDYSPDCWQKQWTVYFNTIDPSIMVLNYEYGYLSQVIAWMLAWAKPVWPFTILYKKYVTTFWDFMAELRKEFPYAEISVMAHSFGTWILHECLKNYEALPLRNIVLIAGVTSEHIEETPYLALLENGTIGSLVAWSSHKDKLVHYWALPPFKKLGYYGFLRKDHPEDIVSPVLYPYSNVTNKVTSEPHDGVTDNGEKLYGTEIFNELTA